MTTPNVISSRGVATTPTLVDGVEKVRYSDKELEEFREIILEKLKIANGDYQMQRSYNSPGNGTNDTSPTFKIVEEGAETYSNEINSHLAARQLKFIKQLENALFRIENKTYGICFVTGKLISKERLRACPTTTKDVFAKRQN